MEMVIMFVDSFSLQRETNGVSALVLSKTPGCFIGQ